MTPRDDEANCAESPVLIAIEALRLLKTSMLPPDAASKIANDVTVPHGAEAGPKVRTFVFAVEPVSAGPNVTAWRE